MAHIVYTLPEEVIERLKLKGQSEIERLRGVFEEEHKPDYPCQQCIVATSRYFAKNNTPVLRHACTYCFGMLPESEQVHYAHKP